MTLVVHFVRHAATDALGRLLTGRQGGWPLNDEGLDQAEALAGRLERERIDAIFSSPLERAVQTAAPIALRKRLDVEVAADLVEIDVGDWSGARLEDLDHAPGWGFWNTARSQHRPPNGESMLEVQARAARWLETLWSTRPSGAVAAVSHADVIKAALAHALGLCLDHHARIEVSPASVSTVVIGSWGLKVLKINEAGPWQA